MIKFKPTREKLGIYQDSNYYLVEWVSNNAAQIVFSFAKKGKAITAHFASNKAGLRCIKPAINDFCEFIFYLFPWCEMIFACTRVRSVERLVKKLEFNYLITVGDLHVYKRDK